MSTQDSEAPSSTNVTDLESPYSIFDKRQKVLIVLIVSVAATLAIGPVIGGGVFLIVLVLALPETLRGVVSNGGHTPTNPSARYPLNIYQKATKIKWDAAATPEPAERRRIDILGPLRILCSKQAAPIIFFLAIYYAVWQMSITAMSTLFESKYGLTETQVGLTFIANGVGSIIGTLITGKILDNDYRRVKQLHESRIQNNPESPEAVFPLEKARLRLVPVFAILQCLSIILFGWTIQYHKQVHIAVPIICTFITGWTSVSTQSVIMTYLVDVFHDRSAAASASLNLARCLFAAGGTSFVMPMINGIGVGLAFTICVVVQAFALLSLVVQFRYGSRWRRQAKEN
ncbi:hypothetical protein IL306_010781 [Fusarium sp. DS 682]|nr:hypothetical protein IL306_010781 [Fusarium sp. DS 682]